MKILFPDRELCLKILLIKTMKDLIKKNIIVILLFQLLSSLNFASNTDTTKYIMIDQFGYRPQDTKVAVIVNPQVGFNSEDEFQPGSVYEIRKWDTDEIVFIGTPQIWNNGETHTQSGDKGWWFDFSELREEGVYYVFDKENNVGSFKFEINEGVYFKVLKAATRMFFYNRCSIAKEFPFAEPNWTDGTSFTGAHQDTAARFVEDKNNPNTAKDVSGGWFDAGDYNKYVTFAEIPVHQLLDAYTQNKKAWTDDFNIPESGNGIPDIIDEVLFEIDWLKKMQDVNDGGVHIKMGSITYNLSSPPSADKSYRFYGPKCSSSSIAAAGIFAHAALVLKEFPSFTNYVNDLTQRAKLAWDWFNSNPMSSNCDTQEIKAGDADRNENDQKMSAVTAAVYLFALTEENDYSNYVVNKYKDVTLLNTWTPYNVCHSDALLFYTKLAKSNKMVVNDIITKLVNQSNILKAFYRFYDDDLYRSNMPDRQYHWGSNGVKANMGNNNYNLIFYNYDVDNHSSYLEKAISSLHYFHGINPSSLVYLSNMYEYGAERSINEIYHGWFNDGTVWDNAITSSKGPAPGYVSGGVNKFYSGDTPGISNQPTLKCYKDYNTGWPANSWEISEPAIYYQSAYIKLLSKFVDASKAVSINREDVPKLFKNEIFSLLQNYPNPFNPSTKIKYQLFTASYLKLEIYNSLGQLVHKLVDEVQNKGEYQVN